MMGAILILGIIYSLYGIAGILGIQHIPPAHQGKSWSRQYKKSSGINWLLLGIPCIILYIVCQNISIRISTGILLLGPLFTPAIVHIVMSEKKFRHMLENQEQADQAAKQEEQKNDF